MPRGDKSPHSLCTLSTILIQLSTTIQQPHSFTHGLHSWVVSMDLSSEDGVSSLPPQACGLSPDYLISLRALALSSEPPPHHP